MQLVLNVLYSPVHLLASFSLLYTVPLNLMIKGCLIGVQGLDRSMGQPVNRHASLMILCLGENRGITGRGSNLLPIPVSICHKRLLLW